jgi:hypothetical protein
MKRVMGCTAFVIGFITGASLVQRMLPGPSDVKIRLPLI